MTIDLKKLAKKFPEEDIEWRIQQCGKGNNNNYWAMIVPYITSRAIMQRLDDCCLGKWQDEFKPSPCGTGYMCGISIKIDNEWVTRWDGAEKSGGNIDNVKTTISNSMKRTGVQWGIGRYLYQFDTVFALVEHCDYRGDCKDGWLFHENKDKGEKFKWRPPTLESWALPVTEKEVKAYIGAMEEAEDDEILKGIFTKAYKAATSENDDEMLASFTKAKNTAKQRLVDDRKQKKNTEHDALLEVIKEQIEIINDGINESAIKGLTEVAIDKVKQISKGNNLKQAMQAIKTASKKKINQIKGS